MSFPVVFDDAAIFPPGNLALAEAVDAHRGHRGALYADLVGPLVVGAADLGHLERLGQLGRLPEEEPLELAVVVPDAEGAVAALERAARIDGLRVVALEVRSARPAQLVGALGEEGTVLTHVELSRGAAVAEQVAELAGSSIRAKIRTGGVEASMYPDEAELAATVVALVEARVQFKATAGLHHALRNTDPATGFEQHGFVNLVAATEAAQGGATAAEVASVLAERDVRRLPSPPALPVRSLLGSVGTCSIVEPVTELVALGLWTEPRPDPTHAAEVTS